MSISKTKGSRDGSTVIFAEIDKEQLPRTIRFFLPKPKGLHYIFKYIKPNKFNIQGNPFECCLWVSGNSGNPSGSVVKKPPAYAEDAGDRGSIPDLEDMLEEETAAHSSILARKIPQTKKPDGLQLMGSPRVKYD